MDAILEMIKSTKCLLRDSLAICSELETQLIDRNPNESEKFGNAAIDRLREVKSVLGNLKDIKEKILIEEDRDKIEEEENKKQKNKKDEDNKEEKEKGKETNKGEKEEKEEKEKKDKKNKENENKERNKDQLTSCSESETESVVRDILMELIDGIGNKNGDNLSTNIDHKKCVISNRKRNNFEKTNNINGDSKNIFDILSIPKGKVDHEKKIGDVRIVLSDIVTDLEDDDYSVVPAVNSGKRDDLTESIDMNEEVIGDDVTVLNCAAKEEILKDSDTDSLIECESGFNETHSLIKECRVVLYDISRLNPDININDTQNFQKLEREINRLCQIPNCKKIKKVNISNAKKPKRSAVNNPSKRSSNIYQSDSDDCSESSENKSKNSDFDIKLNYMDEPPLSSTDSDSSVQMEMSDEVLVSNGKSKSNPDRKAKSKSQKTLKIPKLSTSDSGNELKSNSGSYVSTRKRKSNTKRKAIYCSSDSTNESESDASLSDLHKKITKKKKSLTKSRSEKSKSNKHQKIEKPDSKNNKKEEVKQSTVNEEKEEGEEIETRKNIHKIITGSKLSKATKTAEQLENERRKRIEERQKEYNKDALDEDLQMISSNLTLVLEKDNDGNPIVEVAKSILDNLKPHQVEAVKFLWDCVIESVKCLQLSQQPNNDEDKKTSAVGGCVLAHCMGLGKTLSLIAFMHTMLTTASLKLRTCLVVCPVNTALNWKKEWEMWIPKDKPVKIFEVCSTECKKSKVQVVQDWYNKGGVLIIGYEMYRLLATGDNRTVRRKIIKQSLGEALVDPGPDFVVCDEGHLLKNNKSAINKVITKINTRRRIVLTGTPLQNKLLEYHTMVQFVKPNLLGTQKEFLNRFVNPIHNGQHINSTPYDVSIMKKRSHILFKTLDGCVHRRDYSALVKYLPPKYEYVIKIRLSDIQIKLYREYISMCRKNKHSLFQDHLMFSRIWTHPFVICMHQEIMDKKMFFVESDEDENDSFINDDSDEGSKEAEEKPTTKSSSNNGDIINLVSDESETDGPPKKKSKNQEKKDKSSSDSDSSVDEVVRNWCTSSRSVKRNELMDSGDELVINGIKDLKDNNSADKHWWSDIIKPEHEHQIEISGKLSVLFEILRKSSDIGDKVIIFSQSLLVLDIIEKYLQELHTIAEKVQEDLKKLNESIEESPTANEDLPKNNAFFSDTGYNSWIKGLDYDRMDGSTQAFVRADIQSRFNSFDEQRLRLFLISTRAGGMGVNLVAANRVVIFDVSWNPSNDIQAIFRSYRFGQIKPVYVYRLVSQGTMEEKIYERQVTKQSLSLRVVDEQQISRYFTEEDLRSLYKFEPDIYDPDKVRETPILPKDRFLAELIQELPQFIHGYHEHDSLLQNKTEEELTESERQDAWKEFEEEKIRGTRPFPMNQMQQRPMHDQARIQQFQISMMLQQYPQYATLYAQNYSNLVKYVLSRKPDLNQIQLNNEVQQVFLQSIQKYFTYPPNTMTTEQPIDAQAGSSQPM